MILPKSYLDDTMGVRPGPEQGSFNNVIFSYWYTVARKEQGKLNNPDLDALKIHLELNDDGYGLYKPKNSHDNITYKMLAQKTFKIGSTDDMNFWKAIKDIGFFRIWDVIIYGAVFGPKLLRPLFKLFLFIPCMQIVDAIKKKEKIRPSWYDKNDFKNSRILWWFRKRELINEEPHGPTMLKDWKLSNGEVRRSAHMQNDGKHIALFKLYELRKEFPIFERCAQKCRKLLIDRYGKDYGYEIVNNYFMDRKHPVIAMWKGHGDILK